MPLRDYLLNNIGWKLASLVLAIVIWISIHPSVEKDSLRNRTRDFILPIGVMTSPANPCGFVITPSTVTVTLRGAPNELSRLQTTNFQVFVDLVGVKEASGLKRRLLVHTPGNVTVVTMTPPEVQVDRVSSGDPPVKPTRNSL